MQSIYEPVINVQKNILKQQKRQKKSQQLKKAFGKNYFTHKKLKESYESLDCLNISYERFRLIIELCYYENEREYAGTYLLLIPTPLSTGYLVVKFLLFFNRSAV